MSTFLDGPAEGIGLQLRRAPFVLRVVQSRNRNWDALDQLDDEPKPTEQIFVYRLEGPPFRYHQSCRSVNKKASGFYESGDYRVLPEQPAEQDVRTNAAWTAWCDANQQRLTEGTWAVGRVEVNGSAQGPPADEPAGA